MSEPDRIAELNRLASGEMSGREALELMRRMLREPELQEAYEQLCEVDLLAREAAFDEAEVDSDEATVEGGTPTGSYRRRQIEAVLRRTENATPPRRPWLRLPRGFFRRWAPTVGAAAALFVVGVLLSQLHEGAAEPARAPQIDPERIARMKELHQGLGDVVVMLQGATPAVQHVDSGGAERAVVRISVIRSKDPHNPWVGDILIPVGFSHELVLRGGEGWTPESVKIRVDRVGEALVSVTLDAELAPAARIEQTVDVPRDESTFVSEIRGGDVRYRIFIEVRPERPGQGAA